MFLDTINDTMPNKYVDTYSIIRNSYVNDYETICTMKTIVCYKNQM